MYELTYILRPELPEAEITQAAKKVADLIVKGNGSILSERIGQKRKLSYPIKKTKFGYYTIVEFEASPSLIIDFDKDLKLSKDILRHLIIVKKAASGKMPAMPKIQKVIKRKVGPTTKIQAPPALPKVTLEEIDKKLEEILEK